MDSEYHEARLSAVSFIMTRPSFTSRIDFLDTGLDRALLEVNSEPIVRSPSAQVP